MKKVFITIISMLLPLMVNGAIEINGIWYNLNDNDNTAEVVSSQGTTYSGDISIRSYVYRNKSYTVTSIGNNAFEGCVDMTSVTLPNSLTNIGNGAFWECSSLKSVYIPEGVTTIGEGAFHNCFSLVSVFIPSSVTSIGSSAFSKCNNLTRVFSLIQTPFSINNNVFTTYSTTTLFTPNGTKTAYLAKSGWNNFTNINDEQKRTIHVATAGTLSNYISDYEKYYLEELTLSGELNGTDIRFIRHMSGIDYEWSFWDTEEPYGDIGTPGKLKTLDISNVKIVGGEVYYCKSTGTARYTCYSSEDNKITSYMFYNLQSIKLPNSVTSIEGWAFQNCRDLTSVTIPNSVTSIGGGAFGYCIGLTSITIPNSVTSIGNSAFSGCTGLTSITIPNSVTSIGNSAFSGCTGLTSITIPNSVTSIGNSAFSGCSGLTSITIPNSVISIGEGAFSYCTGLTSFTIPVSVKSIERSTFLDCTALTSITIPNNVTTIGESSFDGCSSLLSFTIPNSVTSIGYKAFSGCAGLSSLVIPNNVTNIEANAFRGCSGLTSVNIPNSLTSIGIGTFCDCISLTTITIPQTVTSLGSLAFYNCSSLKTIYSNIEWPFNIYADVFSEKTYINAQLIVPKDKKWFYQQTEGWNKFKNIVEASEVGMKFEVDGICYSIGENNTVSVFPREMKYSGDIVIPESVEYNGKVYSVKSIRHYAFEDCKDLSSVTIPNSVTAIGGSAFDGSGLGSITIPSSVMSIGGGAFDQCHHLYAVHITDLEAWCQIEFADFDSNPLNYAHHLYLDGKEITNLVIPNGVTSIRDWAFSGCSELTSITIPNNIMSIDNYAFRNCKGLTSIISEIENPFAISDNVFDCYDRDIFITTTLIVPIGKKSAYQNTTGWNKFHNIFEASVVGKEFEADGVRYLIGENNTVSVVTRDAKYSGAVAIPNQVAFNGNNYAVTSIGPSAFEGCVELTSVSIPSSVLSIGGAAFYYCTSLTAVDIPNGVTTIGEGAFSKCGGLISVNIPGSVTSIGINAFFQCYGLTQITSGIENPFAIDNGVFPTSVYNEASLIVPSGKKSAYQNTEGWKRFQKIYHADGIYTLTYYVDGEAYKSVKYSYGAGITPEVEPAKIGYTFSGWSDVPKTMPNDDVTVTGTFTANKYNLTYKVDGEVYQTYLLEYGTPITPEAEPTKEGYTFSGWSYVPSTMPAEDVNVVGTFTVNQYTITYMIDGEKYASVTVDFNSKIVPPTPPSKDGFDFAWEEYPETMPAHDITINGAYTTTGILSIAIESGKAKIFTLDGRQVDTPQKGINIIRMDDGTIKKAVIK